MSNTIVLKKNANKAIEKCERRLTELGKNHEKRERNKETWLSKLLKGKSTRIGGDKTVKKVESKLALDLFLKQQRAHAALERVGVSK
jgi:hypothetical protein